MEPDLIVFYTALSCINAGILLWILWLIVRHNQVARGIFNDVERGTELRPI